MPRTGLLSHDWRSAGTLAERHAPVIYPPRAVRCAHIYIYIYIDPRSEPPPPEFDRHAGKSGG